MKMKEAENVYLKLSDRVGDSFEDAGLRPTSIHHCDELGQTVSCAPGFAD